ncbi:B-cell receptor-associated protein 31-like [Acanthaster planci]|uniref:Endoplasmic reticulum transmembrane protein n=1 Tax=Acanthaster planci TaxID=133434 RepID=A0A8B7Z6Z1_ACAPL|nr:B-cell receptor-associated protein 31-like [Acanthaster planci]XP_022100727.1 B-cell receptor-associated protein 31-like [Acanthaster planci]XP_022100735.1 B-cell receptor-associated protein 31-like [Acanthaster planci]XP_022100746.1 B-cell receptor-associated protein 31-like [Acanthaster planci]XP_022100752.1 B-cell receptor-associated protein 31-like [Acanthaster planci]XP_022100760.1 B-cell receptor-associated protein 31-like [Acanthaster planci]
MTLQWTFVAGFLYLEAAVLLLLLLPFIKPYMWQKIFNSSILKTINSFSYIYFNVFIAILGLLFVDAIRDVRKYSSAYAEIDVSVPGAEVQLNMKLFRSQRNLYIAGFALFLWLVLRRVCTLISTEARLQASNEASIKQAQSASDHAQKLMKELQELKDAQKGDGTSVDEIPENKANEEVKKYKEELEAAKKELQQAKTDLTSIKKQAEGVNMEYDRLLKEHANLQKTVEEIDKKDS